MSSNPSNTPFFPSIPPVSSQTNEPIQIKKEITTANGYRLPEVNTLLHATKLSTAEDKPILMDYWTGSLDKSVLIGIKENKEKLLVKSEDEYTSPVARIFKVCKEYIIITENSIYIVDTGITIDKIFTLLRAHQPSSVKIATLLYKPDAFKGKNAPHYVGFTIPNVFVVGFGLDYNEKGRNLEAIYQLKGNDPAQ